MARYKVILAYDGTYFSGSQRQAETRTVQAVLEAALRKLGWLERSIQLAGRTDSGVHALGQVAAFNLDWNHAPEALLRALNALLPEDLAVQALTAVPAGFHPRYDALARRYRYRLLCDPIRQPLAERYAWRAWPQPELELLQLAAAELPGVHDFAAFGSPHRQGGSTVRQVLTAAWSAFPGGFTFEITGNAFLYHMVRRLVQVQVSIAQGQQALALISKSLQHPPETPLQGLAPPQGLTLVEVHYPDQTRRE
ncbi:MAG: tRNA pseudouridine(38-40) synthase TruA [Anaerolineales bacterium]|nr:tRNA pseudouridine(38-40) synthase TruA [Anaerolineales bacterium]